MLDLATAECARTAFAPHRMKKLCRLALALHCALPLLLSACKPAAVPQPSQPGKAPSTQNVSASPSQPAPPSFYAAPFERRPPAAELTALGRTLFFDRALSASGRLACASCHDPAHAYGPANALPVQAGGVDLSSLGIRAVPSLMYQQDTPPFSEHFSDTDGDDSVDLGPTGGRGWDGRASSAHEQAELPLLSRFEMANASRGDVLARLERGTSAGRFRRAFGEHVFDDPGLAWNGLLLALEVFQQSPADFYPYSSKYDAWLRGKSGLSAQEQRGLTLFNDRTKGNCARCHPSAVKRGALPQFSDRGLVAIGVPRNSDIPANRDRSYADMGLCGPIRTDLTTPHAYCGLFKTPTLRNVARRRSFFHNGLYHRLEDVLDFYAERDVHPEKFYPRDAEGRVRKFDDLPDAYVNNIDVEAPFDRVPGQPPRLSKAERADIITFLRTLTDGYAAPPGPGGSEPSRR